MLFIFTLVTFQRCHFLPLVLLFALSSIRGGGVGGGPVEAMSLEVKVMAMAIAVLYDCQPWH
jgi:hypothetical protein